jgi:hypothetical protein
VTHVHPKAKWWPGGIEQNTKDPLVALFADAKSVANTFQASGRGTGVRFLRHSVTRTQTTFCLWMSDRFGLSGVEDKIHEPLGPANADHVPGRYIAH